MDDDYFSLGTMRLPTMDPMGPPHGPARRKDHKENHHDAEQDEGAGPQGAVLQKPPGQRARHGRRLPALVHPAAHPSAPPLAHPPPGHGQQLQPQQRPQQLVREGAVVDGRPALTARHEQFGVGRQGR